MNIALFVGAYSGSATLLTRAGVIASQMSEKGHQTRLFCLDEHFSQGKGLLRGEREGQTICAVGQAHFRVIEGRKVRLNNFYYGLQILKALWRLKEHVKEFSPEIIHIFTCDPVSLLAVVFFKLLGYRVAIDTDDYVYGMVRLSYGRLSALLQKVLEDRLPYLADGISVISHNLARKYRDSFWVPVMVNREEFAKRGPITTHLKTIQVICLGIFSPYQGQGAFLELIPRILAQINAVQFAFVGGGECLDKLRRRAKELALDNHVYFTGQVSRPQFVSYLLSSHIGVCLFRKDEFNFYRSPTKLFQYMAAGVVPVATDWGEASYLITHKEDGWLVPAADDDAVEEAVVYLALHRQELSRLSQNAIKTASQYDVDKIMRRWTDFYNLALAHG